MAHLLPLFKPPAERCGRSYVENVSPDGHCVVHDPSELAKQRADPLCSGRNVDAQQFLYGQRVGLLVAHHGDVVQPVEIGKTLEGGKEGGRGEGVREGGRGGGRSRKAKLEHSLFKWYCILV